MRKFTLLFALNLFCFHSWGQSVATSLNESFNADCVSASFPTGGGWLDNNPIPSTIAAGGAWMCTSTEGRPLSSGGTTPGMKCSGIFGSVYNLDTSYLISPLLNLSGYPGHVYIQFDTRLSRVYLHGSSLSPLLYPDSDSGAFAITLPSINLDSLVSPVFNDTDTSVWVTREVEVTSYKYTPFYFSFRYSSATTAGSIWYLDNVNVVTTRLGVPETTENELPLTVVGNATANSITIGFTATTPGIFRIAVCDILGKAVYTGSISAGSGHQNYTMSGFSLCPGMYFIRMVNGTAVGTAKALIR